MSTLVTAVPGTGTAVGTDRPPLGLLTALTAAAFAVHGFHPYAEDGGLYVAGIERLLAPALFPHSAAFVDAHLRFSLFAPGVASLVRATHLSLPVVLLLLHLACLWATLLGMWLLAQRAFATRAASVGAATLLAAWLTLPVAGTSLILVDPYLTARSLSLPCTLLAWTATIDLAHRAGRYPWLRLAAALLVAALMHPLMAAYALASVLLLLALLSTQSSVRRWSTAALCAAGVAAAALLADTAAPDTPAYTQVALSRYYWFLSRWQSYEILGLAAPLVLLFFAHRAGRRLSPTARALTRMALCAGTTSTVIALLFAHESSASHLVARLQPLRAFQSVYLVMILLLGGLLGERLLRASVWRTGAAFLLLGSPLFLAQRAIFPSSAHIEWPAAAPVNRYERAFLWVAAHTPPDALFALDPHYIQAPGEDAQSFRAIARRSALPDYSKDGGEASITPALTAVWTAAQHAQANLVTETDAARLAALQPLGVDWIVLPMSAQTALPCPFRNDAVQVCRLR